MQVKVVATSPSTDGENPGEPLSGQLRVTPALLLFLWAPRWSQPPLTTHWLTLTLSLSSSVCQRSFLTSAPSDASHSTHAGKT